MFLTVDIGNSAIKVGLFDRDLLIKKSTFDARDVGSIAAADEPSVDGVWISSVVPTLNDAVLEVIRNGFGINGVIIENSCDFGIDVRYRPLEDAGTDRLLNSSAAAHLYGTPVVAISFGTATTIDVVDKDFVLLGGLIAPGLQMSANALHERTARLPLVELPHRAEAINQTTVSSIQAGIALSQVGLVDEVLDRVEREIGKCTVVATGGHAALIAEIGGRIDIVDPDLLLKGIARLHLKAHDEASSRR